MPVYSWVSSASVSVLNHCFRPLHSLLLIVGALKEMICGIFLARRPDAAFRMSEKTVHSPCTVSMLNRDGGNCHSFACKAEIGQERTTE